MVDVLVLNATYEALNVTSLQRAVKLVFAGKAEVLHNHEKLLRAATSELGMPPILPMLYPTRRPRQQVALTKKNVLLRDDYRCQYCGGKGEGQMTVDHVVPRSAGGPSTWENLVCACLICNNRKNNRTPQDANLHLLRKPRTPKYIPWIQVKRHTVPGEWYKFLFLYDVSIEERIEA